jgi:phage terminase large subunit-like protein
VRRSAADHPDLQATLWRPRARRGPVCQYTWEGVTCGRRGAHHCEPRAQKVVDFFARMLVHTKGIYARQAFRPEPFQEWEILRPLFGEVVWSVEYGRYGRRYRTAYIILARKNGKSEIAAGIALYLLLADDEESAEVYGAAADTKQAGKVFEPAKRMVDLSPALRSRVGHNKNARRLYYEQTASYYEVITADAEGELGHNPHGFVLDEVLSQRDGSLWQALDTARGARTQELMMICSTETDRPGSFGADKIDEAERAAEDPAAYPDVFSYVRKLPRDAAALKSLRALYAGHPDLPVSTDPFDEANWRWPNPALDVFLSREAMRRDAEAAQREPEKENGFRQFKVNQRVSQTTRWMPMHVYDSACGELWLHPDQRVQEYVGRQAFFGLDLSARFDLTAWCLLFPGEPDLDADPDDEAPGPVADLRWRFWCPESAMKGLDQSTNYRASRWRDDGWLTVTEGDVIDYDRVYADIAEDVLLFRLAAGDADEWSSFPVLQEVANRTSLKVDETMAVYKSTFERMSPGMTDLMAMVREQTVAHHGNPVARWCFDNVEVRHAPYNPDVIRPDKPLRLPGGKRIDAVPAAVMAVNASRRVQKVKVPQVHEWPADLVGAG